MTHTQQASCDLSEEEVARRRVEFERAEQDYNRIEHAVKIAGIPLDGPSK